MNKKNYLLNLMKPTSVLKLIDSFLPWVSGITLLFTGLGLWQALIVSPPDYQQGDLVRIMYVHVPASWMALMVYGFMAVNSALFLICRLPVADLMAFSAAPIGLCFTVVSLVTGSIWGKPTWGTWWVWDARLTSMLILFFLYLGYLSFRDNFNNPERAQKASCLLGVLGAINLPIIKGSVVWWNTLHQPASVMRWAKPALSGSMLTPLLLMAGAFLGYFCVVWMIRLRQALKISCASAWYRLELTPKNL